MLLCKVWLLPCPYLFFTTLTCLLAYAGIDWQSIQNTLYPFMFV